MPQPAFAPSTATLDATLWSINVWNPAKVCRFSISNRKVWNTVRAAGNPCGSNLIQPDCNRSVPDHAGGPEG